MEDEQKTLEQVEKNFELIREFKIEQEKQKRRGLNNYNILTAVLNKTDEVRLHSRMLYSLLNPNGTHFQDSLFLNIFIKELNLKDFELDIDNCIVYKEHEYIDLYITDGSKHIIIENKIYAGDQKEQIKRYIETIRKASNNKLSINDLVVVYLTIDRDKPSDYSLGNLVINGGFIKDGINNIAQFKSIFYKKEILGWLKKCQYEVQNITNLNEVFNQYIDVVNMLNNQHKSKLMDLSDYIKNNKSIYEMAEEISRVFPEVQNKLIDDFFVKTINNLRTELGDEWVIELKGNLSKSYGCPLRLCKKSWISQEKRLYFAFEFDASNYRRGYFGVVRSLDTINLKESVAHKLLDEISELKCKRGCGLGSEGWLYYEFIPNIEGCELPRYIIKNDDFQEKFIDWIVSIVKDFEDIVTKINEDLKGS